MVGLSQRAVLCFNSVHQLFTHWSVNSLSPAPSDPQLVAGGGCSMLAARHH